MSNALAHKETTALSTHNHTKNEEILSGSILIPKLLLMQGLSDLVAERKATMGDFVKSLTQQVVGNPDQPVGFIPVTFTNTWIITEKVGNKYEYRSQEPLTAMNQDLPWDFKQNGTDWKRTKSLNLYALLTEDIAAEKAEIAKFKETGEMPDPTKALLPVVISFRSTSYSAGKKIMTHFQMCRKFNAPGYASTMALSCSQEKNDKGTYYVLDVTTTGKTTKENMELAGYWYDVVSSGQHKVDESDLGMAEAAESDDV